jgi:hypothetical protein
VDFDEKLALTILEEQIKNPNQHARREHSIKGWGSDLSFDYVKLMPNTGPKEQKMQKYIEKAEY